MGIINNLINSIKDNFTMAEFSINGRMTVKSLRKQFKDAFGASLRVYKGAKFAPEDATLASIRSGENVKGGELVCKGNLQVGNFEAKMKEIGVGQVATVAGRYYAMDRDNRWDRVEKAYRALVKGEGDEAVSATEGIQASYDKDVTDEFVVPMVIMKDGAPTATVKDGDSIIFFNFRPDRAREITRTFCDDDFTGFDRGERVKTTYVCFTEYDVTIPNKQVAFVKEEITNTFGEFLAAHNMKQARIAETEKYAHVTFFFNGGVEEPNPGEDRILVKSPNVAKYDLKP